METKCKSSVASALSVVIEAANERWPGQWHSVEFVQHDGLDKFVLCRKHNYTSIPLYSAANLGDLLEKIQKDPD